ncbi:FecR family protein [Carboxylicivirga taeanensis]|uniref:FecR family protein n=1 Tax=Carboxylicivirga taeanensis TaxID=1416875 RepID=UPI003F6DD80B
MNHTQKEALAIKYLSGESTLAELEQLKALLKEDAEFRKHFIELRDTWNAANPAEFNSRDAFEVFKKRIEGKKVHHPKSIKFGWLKFAAAAVIAATLLVGKFILPESKSEILHYTHQTAAGERKSIELPDGTNVWLNGNTVLSYTSDFNQLGRNVKLSGEAFFEVQHNASQPFKVYSDNHVVEVLGTRFKLEARKELPVIKTVLEEGKVQVTVPAKQQYCILLPGQKSEYHKERNELQKTTAGEMAQYTALTKGQLVFKDEPLGSLATRLENWYGVSIEVDTAIEGLRFTGTFENESIHEVLKILSMPNGLKYSITNKQVKISPD